MKKISVCLLAILICASLHAQSLQEQIDEAKFQVTKKTIEFLSTDKTTFKDVKENTCSNCKSYDELKQFIDNNKITGANNKIVEPLHNTAIDTSPENWKSSFNSFAQKSDNLITGAGKEKRKQLDGYKDYKGSVSKIIDGIMPPEQSQKQPAANAQIKDSASAPTNSPAAETVKDNVAGSMSSSAMPAWLLYGALLVLLIIAIFFYFKIIALKKEKAEIKTKLYDSYESPLSTNSQLITSLKKKIEDAEKKIKELEEDYKFEKDINLRLEKEKKLLEDVKDKETPKPVQNNEQQIKNEGGELKKEPVKIIKYARYADTGDGFSDANLLDSIDNKTIFEITILPNKKNAELRVVDNPAAQHYALSNTQYFLGTACKYDSMPEENVTIHTNIPGKLELNASKWKIIEPAKISFA